MNVSVKFATVPVGQGDREANGVKPVEGCIGVSGGELLDGVVDAGHGFEKGGSSRSR